MISTNWVFIVEPNKNMQYPIISAEDFRQIFPPSRRASVNILHRTLVYRQVIQLNLVTVLKVAKCVHKLWQQTRKSLNNYTDKKNHPQYALPIGRQAQRTYTTHTHIHTHACTPIHAHRYPYIWMQVQRT